MADLPIPMSAPMVLACLREIEAPGTGKTQTRRVIEPYEATVHPFRGNKPAPRNLIVLRLPARLGGFIAGPSFNPRYAVGDRLYVREHWRCSAKHDDTAPRDLTPRSMTIAFEAGGSIANQDSRDDWRPSPLSYTDADWIGRFRQGMFMPRWASRLTLIVTEVRVERLQDISEADAIAEGIDDRDPVCGYSELWDQINGPGAWDANPWVAAYTFRTILGNIDKIAA